MAVNIDGQLTNNGGQMWIGPTFNPLSLFAASEQGAWYDVSDTSTMFQDSAGTTPVTAVEQAVGLILDKSKGLVLGPDLLTNGNFANGITGWTISASGTATVTSGVIRVTTISAGRGTASQAITTVIGQQYRISLSSISNGNAGSGAAVIRVTSTNSYAGTLVAQTGIASANGFLFFTATTTTSYVWLAENSATIGNYVEFGGLSIKSDSGNHASQSSSASRPILRARYNLLTYSEQFDNAAWTKTFTTVSQNAAVAPDGTTTADKIVSQNATDFMFVRQTPTLTAGTYTQSVYAKASEWNFVELHVDDSGGQKIAVVADLTTGAITATAGSGTATSVGNGWWRITGTGTCTTAPTLVQVNIANNNTQAKQAGNGTAGVFVWGAQIVPVTVFPNNTYQRIAAATDYATGPQFPQYLAFDGTDDSLLTASVNFSATDKMTVWAGVTRNSSLLNYECITELSADAGANNGTFGVFKSVTANQYYYLLRGSVFLDANTTASFPSPITNVLQISNDIALLTSSEELTSRINGASNFLTYTNGPTAGTGNFGNYPIYIGRRNNSMYPFNGRLYQLVIRGAASTADQINAMETYIDNIVGAY